MRYMVRNIVGTMVAVGMNKLTPASFQEVFNAMDRARAGATAPAHGLFLMEVNYS